MSSQYPSAIHPVLHPAVDDWPPVEVVMPPVVAGDAEVIAVVVGVVLGVVIVVDVVIIGVVVGIVVDAAVVAINKYQVGE